MKRTSILIVLLLSLPLGIGGVTWQSGYDLFQKALLLERADGKLQEAIVLYQRIVKEFQDESLAARAQLQIGVCYEKLGLREARTAYQTVIDKYPRQQEEVKAAKERIAQLAGAAEKAVYTPKFRKIRTPFNIPLWSGSRLSPDGKILAFGSGTAIWTVPIPGKVDPGLAGEPKEVQGAANVLGAGLSWSGDGAWIAFSRAYVRAGGSRIDFKPEGAYIDVIPSSGGEPKRIPVPQWIATKGDTSRRLSLSPDGKTIAFDSGGQIFAASVDTGNIRQVTKDGGLAPCFSPDGKKIAYLTPPVRQDNPPARFHDVMVITAEGNDPVKINGNLNSNFSSTGPFWSPDGRMIAIGRIVIGPPVRAELCIVPLSAVGRPLDSPIQIELPMFTRDFICGWTPDNKIGLLLETPYHEYVYTIPLTGGKASQVSPLEGLAGIPRWSPDGKRIFFRWKGGGLGSVPSDGGDVNAHPGLEDARKTGFFTIYPGAGNSVSPDGKTVVFSAGWATSGPNLYTVLVGGGEPRQITSGGAYPCWSPDGRWIAYLAPGDIGEGKSIPTIFKISADGGEILKVSRQSDNVERAGIDWSPDGKSIACFSKEAGASTGTLNLVPIDGGKAREVCRVQDVSGHSDVSWSPDGQKLAFVSRGKIWVVPAVGGEPVEVKTDVDAVAGTLDWSPDCRKIAFSGESGMENEFWFMEDFLPLLKKEGARQR